MRFHAPGLEDFDEVHESVLVGRRFVSHVLGLPAWTHHIKGACTDDRAEEADKG